MAVPTRVRWGEPLGLEDLPASLLPRLDDIITGDLAVVGLCRCVSVYMCVCVCVCVLTYYLSLLLPMYNIEQMFILLVSVKLAVYTASIPHQRC